MATAVKQSNHNVRL